MLNLDRNKIGDFLAFTIYNLLLPKDQYFCESGGCFWCDDYEQIEWMKYLFEGEEKYYDYSPPHRAKNNPLFSKDRVKKNCQELLAFHEDIIKVPGKLKTLLIINTKRGLDILISSMNRNWDRIAVYNANGIYDSLVREHFINIPLVFIPGENIDLKRWGPVLKINNNGEYDRGIKREWSILDQET